MFESLIKKSFFNRFLRKNTQKCAKTKADSNESDTAKKFLYDFLKKIKKQDKKSLTKRRGRDIIGILWGYGSVGRAPRSQRGGQRFESAYLHHDRKA